MPGIKKFPLENDPAIPMPGRVGLKSRTLFNAYEHELSQLALVRMSKGDFEAHPPLSKPLDPANFGAEDFLRRAAGGNVSLMGAGHPTTLNALYDMGRMMAAQGRYAEAEYWLRRAAQGISADMGPNHPNTLRIKRDLGAWPEV